MDQEIQITHNASVKNDGPTVLQEAEQLVGVDRNARYGHPRVAFAQIARLWSEVLGITVTPQQVALCMIAMKVSRQIQRPKRDHIVDICGYARTMELLDEPEG